MKPRQYISLFVTSLFLLYSCSSDTGPMQPPTKTLYAQSALLPLNQESVAMIYDYNEKQARLQYRAIKVEKSSGDPIRDIVNTFIHHSSILASPSSLILDHLEEKTGRAIFSFSGQAEFATPQDSTLFWEALDITLARNYKHNNIEIELLEAQNL